MEVVQYCGGCSVLWGDNISTCMGITSVLWKDNISTVEGIQYCGGIPSVLWGIASVLWEIASVL